MMLGDGTGPAGQMLSYQHPHLMDPAGPQPGNGVMETPSRTYTVTIGHGVLDHVGHSLDVLRLPARRFIVSSPLVWRLHGPWC